MVVYADHSKNMPKIKAAIKDYLNSNKSQETCANDHQITLSSFRYYYHNAKFMEAIKEEMNGGKKNSSDLIRDIFTPNVYNNKPSKSNNNSDSDKKIKLKKNTESKIKSFSEEKNTYKKPPPAPRSDSANKYKRSDSNIDINQLITKPTPLPF